MQAWMILAIVPMMAGCAVQLRDEQPTGLVIEPTIGIYSKSEIDAINAEAECKRLARNLIQLARCTNRRD